LYEDENTNYNYEKGAFSNIPFTYNEATQQLTIGNRQGSFPGMLQNRFFRIVRVSRNKATELNLENIVAETIPYNGKSVTVKLDR
jgi:alpha-D-xyloside xylohydrolase